MIDYRPRSIFTDAAAARDILSCYLDELILVEQAADIDFMPDFIIFILVLVDAPGG